jgi:hypothetical protein
MNITFFLGNGFDLSIGLKTKYSDFYDYYKHVHNASPQIIKLKDSISKNTMQWSDLELALGEYLQNIDSLEQFDEIFTDILNELKNYLLDIERNFDFENISFIELNKHFSEPESYFPNADKEEITEYKNKWSNVDWKLDVITFNYTKSIENIYNKDFKGAVIGSHHSDSIILNDVHHLHGYTDSHMILGVNDNYQLKNELFHDEIDIQDSFIKPLSNKSLKHQVDEQCLNIINSANLICIFGSSLGHTDQIWWEAIGKTITNGAKLLIFHFESGEIDFFKISRVERRVKNTFIMNANIEKEYESNIYVSVNSNIFKFDGV